MRYFRKFYRKTYNLFSDIKWGIIYWWQRRTRGFDTREWVDLNDTSYTWIVPRLKAFRKYTTSVPMAYNLCPHLVEIIKETSELDRVVSEALQEHIDTVEIWNNILDEMIEGFEIAARGAFPDELFADKNYEDLTEEEKQMIFDAEDKLDEKVKNAQRLFAEHLDSLWD